MRLYGITRSVVLLMDRNNYFCVVYLSGGGRCVLIAATERIHYGSVKYLTPCFEPALVSKNSFDFNCQTVLLSSRHFDLLMVKFLIN